MLSDLADLNGICQLSKQRHKDNSGELAYYDCPQFKGIRAASCLLQLICMTAGADLQSVPSLHCMASVYAAVYVVAE